VEVGPDCEFYKPGEDISYIGATTRQGSNAEYQLVSEFSCAHKPKSLDFVQAASFGLTFGTAYQSLHDRLEIKPNENVGILIVRHEFFLPSCTSRCYPGIQWLTCDQINGGGGVGSAAIQMARNVFGLPAVVATASREETIESCKRMGATHVIDHRKDLVEQVIALKLDVPIKYAYAFPSPLPSR
jgi:NADPH:quinone reductase-like Zn-dependent oxidoreductase